jgi:hypothetical protein
VYFRLNTITNCKNVVKQADTLNIFDSTEASNRVTFRWVGQVGGPGRDCRGEQDGRKVVGESPQ